MTTELATIDGEIIEHRPPMTLFGTDDPTAVVERASAVATALASVINERKLYTQIGQKKHVQVEGWTLLGSMLGVFAEVEWSRPLDNGWEARAVARTLAGNVVGAAEAMCTTNEGRWRSADPYAVRSMAQTRSVSKALRLPLGFIMHLAGYSATPAEEVADEQPQDGERGQSSRAVATPARTRPAASPLAQGDGELRDAIAVAALKHGLSTAAMSLMADRVGVPKGQRATREQLEAILALIETPSSGVPTAEMGGEADRSQATASPDTPQPSEGIAARAVSDAAATPPADLPPPPGVAPTMEQILEATGGEEVTPAAARAAVELSEPDGVAAPSGAPPKPGTDAYRLLPSGRERAAAKGYWDRRKAGEPEQETLAQALGAPVAE